MEMLLALMASCFYMLSRIFLQTFRGQVQAYGVKCRC
jgi:hypothetical protein